MSARTDGLDPVRSGYHAASRRFDAAVGSKPPLVAFDFRIADRLVRLQVAGPRLADAFGASWGYLKEGSSGSSGSGCLQIDVWHEAETGIGAPSEIDAIDPCARFPLQASPDDRFLAVRQPETSAWLDRKTRRLVACVRDVDGRALYEAGRPLETPILVWLRDAGVPLVHASFVAHDGRGALILGRSGSGKSTLAAASLDAGFDFLGDDKVAIGRAPDGGFLGYSLNGSLHLDAGSLARLPELGAHAIAPTLPLDDKHRVAVHRTHPDRLRARAPVSALVLPSLRPDGRGIEPAARRQAFLALSLSTVLSLPITRSSSLDALAAVARAVPAFVFELDGGHDAPARLASLLASLPR